MMQVQVSPAIALYGPMRVIRLALATNGAYVTLQRVDGRMRRFLRFADGTVQFSLSRAEVRRLIAAYDGSITSDASNMPQGDSDGGENNPGWESRLLAYYDREE
jgi:hypothetical protein